MRALLVVVAFLVPVPCFAQPPCATTASSNHQQFIPPAPLAAVLERGMYWLGSDKLWVALRDDGRWGGVFRPDLKVYRNKLPLYRVGFDWRREPEPPLNVTARRVNQPPNNGSILADIPHGVSDGTSAFMMTALDLPVGCWQITAQYANEPTLMFVVSVP